MNSQLFILALLEILFSIVLTILIMFASYKILKQVFFKNLEVKENNMAFSIFTSGIIVSIGLILSEILPSITNVIRISLQQENAVSIPELFMYCGLYLFIGFFVAVCINGSVFLLFSLLTKGVNEFKEIQQNNTAVALLVVAILISITLIVKNSIALMISALVPYPSVTNFL
ncbi:MAG: uncharacterized membrane protein YjfL (UPF0719 family) [Patiriisocius sp.]|jgi:uncharacterized membrane protein YjfL (UPF0719 family)